MQIHARRWTLARYSSILDGSLQQHLVQKLHPLHAVVIHPKRRRRVPIEERQQLLRVQGELRPLGDASAVRVEVVDEVDEVVRQVLLVVDVDDVRAVERAEAAQVLVPLEDCFFAFTELRSEVEDQSRRTG